MKFYTSFFIFIILVETIVGQSSRYDKVYTQLYLDIKLKKEYNSSFESKPSIIFNDSISFKNFLDTAGKDNKSQLFIDFSKHQVILDYRCQQCLSVCYSKNGQKHTACHRNACLYSPFFILEETPSSKK